MALLHIERAAAGLGGWDTAHSWLAAAADGDISAGPNATLFFGAPALAFALHGAADAHTPGLTVHLAKLAERLLTPEPAGTAIGLLEGSVGLALALSTAAADELPASRWDACLLT